MTATAAHPVCPCCRMEALRLVMDGEHCDWCKPGSGKPFQASAWPDILERLDRRTEERLERDVARMEDRVCKACGETFTVHPGSHARTCSKDCSKRAQAMQRRATIAAQDGADEWEP